jgi:hypothetical protein
MKEKIMHPQRKQAIKRSKVNWAREIPIKTQDAQLTQYAQLTQ